MKIINKNREDIKNMCGVYKITSPSGKIYVGSTKCFRERYASYKYLSKISGDGQKKLKNSFNKYSFSNMLFEVLVICELEDRLMYERIIGEGLNVLDKHKGMNLSLPGYGEIPQIFSEEHRKNISKATKKRLSNPDNHPNRNFTVYHIKNIFTGDEFRGDFMQIKEYVDISPGRISKVINHPEELDNFKGWCLIEWWDKVKCKISNHEVHNKIKYRNGDILGVDLVFIERTIEKPDKAKFKCNCCKIFVTSISDVKSGKTKSCGCLRKQLLSDKLTGLKRSEESKAKMRVSAKNRFNKPEDNPRYDETIRVFFNKSKNVVFVGTKYYFRIEYNLRDSAVSNLVNKKIKTTKKWSYIGKLDEFNL